MRYAEDLLYFFSINLHNSLLMGFETQTSWCKSINEPLVKPLDQMSFHKQRSSTQQRLDRWVTSEYSFKGKLEFDLHVSAYAFSFCKFYKFWLNSYCYILCNSFVLFFIFYSTLLIYIDLFYAFYCVINFYYILENLLQYTFIKFTACIQYIFKIYLSIV